MSSQKKSEIKKICIIDDDPLILTSVKRALSSSGYEIYGASGREEFVKLLDTERFDLVITDYHLKDCTALDIRNIIYEKSPETLILLMSGKELSPDITLPNIIRKPFSIKELRSMVSELLGGQRSES
ncbi:MAG: response regulator [Thermodesulfovibrionales bacterium]|nr:response regulator [Thermodesulfovibrionales bacterium]